MVLESSRQPPISRGAGADATGWATVLAAEPPPTGIPTNESEE